MLYRETRMRRAIFDQMLRRFVGPDNDAPPGSERLVQVIVPEGAVLYIKEDVDPKAVGLNQAEYKLPPVSPGQTVEFAIQPHQYLVGASSGKIVACAVVIQHIQH